MRILFKQLTTDDVVKLSQEPVFVPLLCIIPKQEEDSESHGMRHLACAIQVFKLAKSTSAINPLLKTLFAKVTALKEVKAILSQMDSGILTLPCDPTLRALQHVISDSTANLVPLSGFEFFTSLQVRLLVTTNASHCQKCQKLCRRIIQGVCEDGIKSKQIMVLGRVLLYA